MKDIMGKLLCFYMVGVLMVVITGCASHSILDSLSEDSNHSFRKVRWGFSQERVELAEAGNRVYERTENALVYRHKINGVDCLLIYTFKDNQLRTAGYVTLAPVMNAENIIKEAVDKHGMPCTAYGFLDHSLKEDCATLTILLKGVSNGETQKIHA